MAKGTQPQKTIQKPSSGTLTPSLAGELALGQALPSTKNITSTIEAVISSGLALSVGIEFRQIINDKNERSLHMCTKNSRNYFFSTIITALTVLSFIFTLVNPCVSLAEEGGSGHYLPGANASFADALPDKPGLAVVNFFTFYDAEAVGNQQLPLAGTADSKVSATVYADTLVGVYVTPLELLGGHYAIGAAIPYVWMEVDGQATINLGQISGSKSVRDTTSNIGDITIYPFMLGWTALGGDLKYDVRLGVYAPTGDFKNGHLANPGKNFWTFEPTITASYISSKIGTEVSVFAGMDFNTKNGATDYQSGDVFHIDGTIAQHLPLFGGIIGAGANGFYYKQITKDSGSGALLGGFMGRTAGVGPVLSYVHKVGNTTLIGEVKWLPELDVKNRLKGDYVWFKLVASF